MSQSFFHACGLLLLGVLALWLAIELLAQFWGWLVLVAALVAAGWLVVAAIRAHRNRW